MNQRERSWLSLIVFFNDYLVCPSSGPTEHINTNDCGTQFTYRVWSSFMEKLGVFVNLVSDNHPKSNGQIKRAKTKFKPSAPRTRQFRHIFFPGLSISRTHCATLPGRMTLFQCAIWYHLLLFPGNFNPKDVSAVDLWIKMSKQVWRAPIND